MSLRRLALLASLAAFLVSGVAVADDENIAQDYKQAKAKGRALMKERAEFWEAKGVTGKDLFWLGRFLDEIGEDEKALKAYDDFLKVPDGNPKNREKAAWETVQIHIDARSWDKVIPAAEQFRKDFGESAVLHQAWNEQGRAHRMKGDKEKAIEAFKNAADMKFTAGMLDLADVYFADGEIDKAKEVIKRYLAMEMPGKEKSLQPMLDALDLYGKPAPKLEGAVSVGREQAPMELTGKPTLILFWHATLPGADGAFRMLGELKKAFGDALQGIAVSGYDKYNAVTKKVEEDLAPEAEAQNYRNFLEQSPVSVDHALVVPDSVKEGLGLKASGQKVVVDAEGKIRYVRLTGASLYDWLAIEYAIKKMLGG